MKNKNKWILLLFILAGIIIGNLIGEVAKNISFLWWLNYGGEFGLVEPVKLNLGVVSLTFGLWFKLSICGIIGMFIAIFAYKKV